MSPQIIITLVLLLSIIGVAAWFYNDKKAMGHIHNRTIAELEIAICTNRNQISLRNSRLNSYDFRRYNLDDALVVQPEIQT